MTIIEVPEDYRWEIKKSREHAVHDGRCTRTGGYARDYSSYDCGILEDVYTLSYQREIMHRQFLGTEVKRSPGKHWWSRDIRTTVRKYSEFEKVWTPQAYGVRLPAEFNSDIIRETAWGILYSLALKDDFNSHDRFIGTYPPKELP